MFETAQRAAMRRACRISAEIEVELTSHGQRASLLLALLGKGQAHAAEAIIGLSDVDPEDPKAIRTLQNEVKCFELLVSWMRELVADGHEADALLQAVDIEDLAEAVGVSSDEAEEMRRNGIAPQTDNGEFE